MQSCIQSFESRRNERAANLAARFISKLKLSILVLQKLTNDDKDLARYPLSLVDKLRSRSSFLTSGATGDRAFGGDFKDLNVDIRRVLPEVRERLQSIQQDVLEKHKECATKVFAMFSELMDVATEIFAELALLAVAFTNIERKIMDLERTIKNFDYRDIAAAKREKDDLFERFHKLLDEFERELNKFKLD